MATDRKYGEVTVENDGGHPLNGTDEPVFVLRAQDQMAMRFLARYKNDYSTIEKPEEQRPKEFFDGLDEVLDDFSKWQAANPELVKLAD